ncbi:MAG: MmgE/PrpD family protein, partial [Roseovarius sp.]|nr:MmgE/PrpD family protein [Roseovarius sp.]
MRPEASSRSCSRSIARRSGSAPQQSNGIIAAAAAAARLLRLTPDQTEAALNNAVSLSGGLLQSFVEGTDEWRYQVGTTAHLGWTATELARAGSTSARSAFEGTKGLAAAFARSEIDVARLASGFGHNWQTLRVAFKPFPVCAFNQTPVTAALELRKKIDVTRIESVAIHMNPYECGYAGMDVRGPFHSISGTLMSIPFCIAQALLRGAPTMTSMTTYDDADVNALESR